MSSDKQIELLLIRFRMIELGTIRLIVLSELLPHYPPLKDLLYTHFIWVMDIKSSTWTKFYEILTKVFVPPGTIVIFTPLFRINML